MIRLIGSAFGIAVLVSIATGGNTIAIEVSFVAALVLSVLALALGRTVLKCPYCHKRVKIGANTCHHCGRSVVRETALSRAIARPDPTTVRRQCPFCKESPIMPDASVCRYCHQPIEPWQLNDGVWWMANDDGTWIWYDQKADVWRRPETPQPSAQPESSTGATPSRCPRCGTSIYARESECPTCNAALRI